MPADQVTFLPNPSLVLVLFFVAIALLAALGYACREWLADVIIDEWLMRGIS